jgi:hypothetical protein
MAGGHHHEGLLGPHVSGDIAAAQGRSGAIWRPVWQGAAPCPDCGVARDREHDARCEVGLAELHDLAPELQASDALAWDKEHPE